MPAIFATLNRLSSGETETLWLWGFLWIAEEGSLGIFVVEFEHHELRILRCARSPFATTWSMLLAFSRRDPSRLWSMDANNVSMI